MPPAPAPSCRRRSCLRRGSPASTSPARACAAASTARCGGCTRALAGGVSASRACLAAQRRTRSLTPLPPPLHGPRAPRVPPAGACRRRPPPRALGAPRECECTRVHTRLKWRPRSNAVTAGAFETGWATCGVLPCAAACFTHSLCTHFQLCYTVFPRSRRCWTAARTAPLSFRGWRSSLKRWATRAGRTGWWCPQARVWIFQGGCKQSATPAGFCADVCANVCRRHS